MGHGCHDCGCPNGCECKALEAQQRALEDAGIEHRGAGYTPSPMGCRYSITLGLNVTVLDSAPTLEEAHTKILTRARRNGLRPGAYNTVDNWAEP